MLTVTKAAAQAKVSRRYIRRLVANGTISGEAVHDRLWLVNPRSFDKWLARKNSSRTP